MPEEFTDETFKERMEIVEALARFATPGPLVNINYEFDNRQLLIDDVVKSLEKSGGNSLHVVFVMGTNKYVAFTGNGPTSEINAAYIAASAPEFVLELIERLRKAEGLPRREQDFDSVKELLLQRLFEVTRNEMGLAQDAEAISDIEQRVASLPSCEDCDG